MTSENKILSEILRNLDLKDNECSQGYIHSISGPVIVGKNLEGVSMYELVRVSSYNLIGEVIKIDGGMVTIQVYEDTCGLEVNDVIKRTYMPLCAELGPGLFENIYDGIQRPLKEIRKRSNSIFIPRGMQINSLDRDKEFYFIPTIQESDLVEGGSILGTVQENSLIKLSILVPPKVSGKIIFMAHEGNYTLNDVIAEVETEQKIIKLYLFHTWPVRTPRPIKSKKIAKNQLFTGQRILDSLFPCVQGGTTAIPGAFGCGKTVISQSLSKYSNSDVIVYVGCGERGNEMSEVLMEFPKLKIKNSEENIMKRTVLIANTSNMPVAAREASIYTGITISEFYRDQGMNVAMMADSTSRWAEALREISGRLAEMPADSGYPAYLSARLALFYERAGYAQNLNNTFGSVSIIGAVSPPGGDFSDPVTSATLNIVQVFWGLDKRLAQRKHFPSINIGVSYSKYLDIIENKPEYKNNIKLTREILQYDKEIDEIVQLVGRNSLSELEKVILDIAKVIKNDFLQQNGYSEYDNHCPFEKTMLMLSNIIQYYKNAIKTIQKYSWIEIKKKTSHVFYQLTQMKFIIADNLMIDKLKEVEMNIQSAFKEYKK
ncbi:hypothetical protein NUSPORA_00942 [Nucleospora cyclopteri]